MFCPLFKVKLKKNTKLKAISITLKSAKLEHDSLLRQNSVEFVTDSTQTMKKFTQALPAHPYLFSSLRRGFSQSAPFHSHNEKYHILAKSKY